MIKIKYVSDITKHTSKIKFPIILYIGNSSNQKYTNSRTQSFNIENETMLVAIIIKLYQQGFNIENLMYEEIEYIEFEEINKTLIKV